MNTVTAGASFTFTLSARDVREIIAANYHGTFGLVSIDTLAVPPGNATLAAGIGTLTATSDGGSLDTASHSPAAKRKDMIFSPRLWTT